MRELSPIRPTTTTQSQLPVGAAEHIAIYSSMDMLPPLGEGLPLRSSLQQTPEPPPPLSSIISRGRLHLLPDEDELQPIPTAVRTTLKDCSASVSSGAIATDSSCLLSSPPSPPLMGSFSPGPSTRSVRKMGSMDDSYCDRYRSTSSFGWYDETTAFDSVDVPQSNKACYQIEDWRNLETWDGGRERRRESHDVRLRERLFVGGSARTFQSWSILSSWQKEEANDGQAADVEFVVPNAQVTTTKTFRHASHGRPEPYAVSIGSTRVRRVSPFAVHAEYQSGYHVDEGQHLQGVEALLRLQAAGGVCQDLGPERYRHGMETHSADSTVVPVPGSQLPQDQVQPPGEVSRTALVRSAHALHALELRRCSTARSRPATITE
ncbi:unnamed protein product [Pylaiella littoralis]